MKELIKKFVEAIGPSGYEDGVREMINAEVQAFADEVKVDALGNLIVRKGCKKDGGLKVMLAAHMDEIGVIVTHIEEGGFVRFTNIGGLRPMTLLGGRVRFVNGVRGVIGMDPLDVPDRIPGLDKFYIDTGATTREDCKMHVGDTGAFDRPFLDLGERLVSKTMDDRISVVVLIEVLRRIKTTPHELYFTFTAQEEVGTRGAQTSAYAIDPDLGLSVDVTGVGDTPKGKMAVSLGNGPAIKVRDGGMLSDPRVVRWLVAAAERLNMPYQLEVLEGGTTDARAIQLVRAGVPSSCVSIPTRYIHTQSEMVDYKDVLNAVALLVNVLSLPIELRLGQNG
jgi:putative aminopeptidase FrvX